MNVNGIKGYQQSNQRPGFKGVAIELKGNEFVTQDLFKIIDKARTAGGYALGHFLDAPHHIIATKAGSPAEASLIGKLEQLSKNDSLEGEFHKLSDNITLEVVEKYNTLNPENQQEIPRIIDVIF